MKRREFMVGCSAALVVSGISPVIAKATTPEMFFSGRPTLSRERFLQLVGENFNVYAKDWSIVRMELLSVEDHQPTEQLDQFRLSFKSGAGKPLEESLYLVNHVKDGDFQLFLTPGEEAGVYQAYFSLLKE